MLSILAITIMSFNIRTAQAPDGNNAWDLRKDACITMITDKQPDVMGLQENTLPQDTFFATQLTMYGHVAVGRETGNPLSETNAIYYRTDKYDLVQTNSFWLSETPNLCSKGWDAKYPRIATYVVIKDKQTEEHYLIFNTHLDHIGATARTQSMQLIADTIASLGKRYPQMPIFVLGDLNVTPEDPALLPTRQTMLSAQEVFKNTDITCHGWGTYGKIIDYIFYQNTYPTSFEVIPDTFGVPYISDHHPIMATFLSANMAKALERPVSEQQKLKNRTTDWCRFYRYEAQNDSVRQWLKSNKKNRTTVVFFGNSITQNWYRFHPEFFHENGFLGRGIGGQTSSQLLTRFREDVLDLNPQVVMLMIGTNDLAQNNGPITQKHIMDNIQSLCELARLHKIQPVLCSVLPAHYFGWNRIVGDVPNLIISLNQAIQAYAQAEKIPYVDYYSAVVDDKGGLKKEYQKDVVHPNKDGYLVMEPIALDMISKLKFKK